MIEINKKIIVSGLLSASELYVFLNMQARSDKNKEVKFGTNKIASEINLSKPTLISIIKKLIEKDYIHEIETSSSDQKRYKIILDVSKEFKNNRNFKKATFDNKDKVLFKSNFKCWYCGITLHKKTVQIDHFIPKSVGGSMDISNLVPACRKCNLTKGNSGIEEFRAKVLEEMSSEYNFSVKQKNILIKKYGSIPDIPAFSFWFEENM